LVYLDIADKVSHVIVALSKVEIVVGLDAELWLASLQGFGHAHIASSCEHCSLPAHRDRESVKITFSSMISAEILLEPFVLT